MSSDKELNKEIIINFLTTLDDSNNIVENILNANMDSQTYGWNNSTLKAVIDGIWIKEKGNEKFNQYLEKIGDL